MKAGAVMRAIAIAGRLFSIGGESKDFLLLGLLQEKAGDTRAASAAYESALGRTDSEETRIFAELCVRMRTSPVHEQENDDEAAGALGQAYIDMGLKSDAATVWLVAFRKRPQSSECGARLADGIANDSIG
jgi:hypothetical protein